MSTGPIPESAIVNHHRRYPLLRLEDFTTVIRTMDGVFLAYKPEKSSG